MPHLTIEYSANLASRLDVPALVLRLHEAVLSTEIFPEKGLRTRTAPRDEYRIADGDVDHAFIHVVLRVGSGRRPDTLARAGDVIFETVCRETKSDQAVNPLAVSFEIQEIDPVLSWKNNNIPDWMARRSQERG